jgi:hypothetical protein
MSYAHTVLAGIALMGAGIAAGLAWAQGSPAAPNLDGTWKIDKPRAILVPAHGALPFTPEARSRYEDNKRAHDSGHYDYDAVQTLCATPGLPRLMLTPDRFRIWQRRDLVTFQFEWNRLFYQVDMTDRKTEPRLVGVNVGESRGKWQGDTLVIRTGNFTDQTLLDALVPHSDELALTQRFRLINANTLEDRITIEDPRTFTRSWEAIIRYGRQPDTPFREDVCVDRRNAGRLPLPPT